MVTGTRTISRWWLAVAVPVLVLVLAAATWAVWYRGTYHLWPGESVPPRIGWCGRDYDRATGPAVPHAEVERLIGRRTEVVARVPPHGPQHDLVAAADGCAALVFLRLGPSRYLVYELQGGL